MKDVEYLIGNDEIVSLPLKAYSHEVLDFAAELSGTIMKAKDVRNYPDLVSFAFWCRKGNIEKLKEGCDDNEVRLGRGLAFHIAPGNIPVNFAFTYMFGLLAGCANIVRLPSRSFPQTDMLVDIIREVLKNHPEVQKRTAFVRYPSDSEATAEFCKRADARMMWGGDATVSKIKAFEAKPRCVDVAFPDRYSLAVVNAEAVNKADGSELKKLAENFYNDTYLMDQNACSSPQLILWTGGTSRDGEVDEGVIDSAQEKFWNAVYAEAERRYFLQDAIGVDKYTKLCQDAIDYGDMIEKTERQGNLLYRVRLGSVDDRLENLRGKAGYFYEYVINGKNIINGIDEELCDKIRETVNEKYQTLTYYGFDPEELRSYVIDNKLRGIDRIVPVGKALDIGVIWDGYDLVRVLSRIVSLL